MKLELVTKQTALCSATALAKKVLIYSSARSRPFGERRTLMILLFIRMNVLPEKQKEMTQTLLSMTETTEREKGCLSYDVFCDIEDKNVLSLMEGWENRDYLERHLKTKNFGVLLGTKSLLSEPLKIQIHTVSHSEEMEAVSAANDNKMRFSKKLKFLKFF